MAADLHIHIFEGLEEGDLEQFFCNAFGSKYFNLDKCRDEGYGEGTVSHRVSHTPGVWIGSVSWLKAGLFEDSETFIPDPVGKIDELIGEDLPTLDEELMKKIMDALDLPNSTSYEIAKPEDVVGFLTAYQGKQVFTVSW